MLAEDARLDELIDRAEASGARLAGAGGGALRDDQGGALILQPDFWDQAGVGRDLRDYVVQHLGDPSGILIVDLCRPRDYADRTTKMFARRAWDTPGLVRNSALTWSRPEGFEPPTSDP